MNEIQDYINSILKDIPIDSKERKDIEDEIKDHLMLSEQEYIIKGYSEKEANKMSIKRFGETKKMKSKFTFTFNPFDKIIRIVASVLFTLYLLIFIKLSFFSHFSHYVAFGPNATRLHNINFIPFKSISQYLFNYHSYNFDIWFNNLFGMIIAFIPFGFLISLIVKRINKINQVIFITISFSMLSEMFQYITRRGIADIDDTILSIIGSVLGFILLKLIIKFLLKIKISSEFETNFQQQV